MSVDQQTTISCDARGGCAARHTVDRGLVDARTLVADAGWRNELLLVGIERRPVWRDLCPLHTGELLGSQPTDQSPVPAGHTAGELEPGSAVWELAMPEAEPHDKYCTGCQILTLIHERDEAERKLSCFHPVGDGIWRVGGMRRSAITNRYITDHIPDPEEES